MWNRAFHHERDRSQIETSYNPRNSQKMEPNLIEGCHIYQSHGGFLRPYVNLSYNY